MEMDVLVMNLKKINEEQNKKRIKIKKYGNELYPLSRTFKKRKAPNFWTLSLN